MIRLLIVDDHDMIRLGLQSLLKNEPEIEIVGEAKNGWEAVTKAKEVKPDVILMDVRMAKTDGIEATQTIMQFAPHIKIIVLTSFDSLKQAEKILNAGAFSYLLKTSHPSKIVKAIHQAVQGEAIIDESIAGKLLSNLRKEKKPHDSLTAREMEIFRAIAQGNSNQEIAEELYISLATVKYHISNLLAKLQVNDRTQAVIYAYKNRLFIDND